MGEFQKGASGELEGRQRAIADLVGPIRASLQQVRAQLRGSRKTAHRRLRDVERAGQSAGPDAAPLLHGETAKLVKALRQPVVRGRWGEMQLRRVVEMAGMLEHCDFIEQPSRSTAEGLLRPDLVVRLPGGKQIVVDAKAPVAAYLDAAEVRMKRRARSC